MAAEATTVCGDGRDQHKQTSHNRILLSALLRYKHESLRER